VTDRKRKPQQGGRRRPAKKSKPLDMWAPVPELPTPQPIAPAADPTAVLRSLGDPPLQGQGAVAGHYIGAFVERAAGLATALAAAAGLLDTGDHTDDSATTD
jgi:hypothetical protein